MKPEPFAELRKFQAGSSRRWRPTHVVFDFDGTLSWLRHGWPELMCQLFLEYYPMRTDESADHVHDEILAEVLSTNGLPSIVQMQRFVERVQARGAKPPTPEELLRQYQGRLDEIIEERSQLLTHGRARLDDFVIFGARTMLDLLEQRRVKLFILSGTLEERVSQEAYLLDLARYFGGRIFGSPRVGGAFSKRAVLEKILADENIAGEQLLCFGDGPVEILHTRELGGLAVAVASDENENSSGRNDPLKQEQLAKAGAHLVIPDYRDAAELLEILFDE
jgi:phosphoglycolate phosphatase-like HAD superfamily hydrolase